MPPENQVIIRERFLNGSTLDDLRRDYDVSLEDVLKAVTTIYVVQSSREEPRWTADDDCPSLGNPTI